MLTSSNTTCLILAGGLGSRLASVVSDVPKPMASVGGRPFLEHLIEQVQAAGVNDFVICVGYLNHVIENHFSDGTGMKARIRYVREEELLGTAGAMAQSLPFVSDPFLAMNGDSYCPLEIASLMQRHASTGAAATVTVSLFPEADRYGVVELDDQDRIQAFREKGVVFGPAFVNAGVYMFAHAALAHVPVGVPCSLERDVFPKLVATGTLMGHRINEPFIDIGTPESFVQASQAVGRLRRLRMDSRITRTNPIDLLF